MCMKAEAKTDVPHVPMLFIELEVRDRNGKVIQRHKQEGKSFLQNFMILLWWVFQGQDGAPLYTQTSSCSTQTGLNFNSPTVFSVLAPAGTDGYGIEIGSGNSPNNANTCWLQTKISNSQVSYGATSVSQNLNTNTQNNTISFQITRQFTNNSGSSVTVAEVGFAIQGSSVPYMIARDVLSSSVSVPNGGTLTVTYTIELTIS